MSYSQLSMLSDILADNQIEELSDYFCSLNDNTKSKITALRIMQVLDVDSKKAMKVLMECKKAGILKISFGIRCPECDALIKTLDEFPLDLSEFSECYFCGEEIEVGSDDVEPVFSLVNGPECFMTGQRQTNVRSKYSSKEGVAPKIRLTSYTDENLININEKMYSPSAQEYEQLDKLYDVVFKADSTSEKGKTLEAFTNYLFSLVKVFRVGNISTKTNQLDCFVRNTYLTESGTFQFVGSRFIIECKNEKKKPRGSYMQKLDDIIALSDPEDKFIQFGIIVSKSSPPSTFKELAVKYYLVHKRIIISLYKDELKKIVYERENLLDIIDRKCNEIILDATSDLKAAGLY